MIRTQDISVLLLYYLGFSRVRNLIFRVRKKPITKILAFHDIMPESLRNFRKNLSYLKRRANVISLDDFFAGRLSIRRVNIVITFDDGYKSWIAHAIPLLREFGLPATFFVSSGFVGLDKEAETEYMRSKLFSTLGARKTTGGLSTKDLKRIAESGFTIGGHTINHCNLAEMNDEERLWREISKDKQGLEKLLGRELTYFAYPFGAFGPSNMDLAGTLAKAGYKAAVTTAPGFNLNSMNPYFLRREPTHALMAYQVFKARVLGNYDGVLFIRKALKMSR